MKYSAPVRDKFLTGLLLVVDDSESISEPCGFLK